MNNREREKKSNYFVISQTLWIQAGEGRFFDLEKRVELKEEAGIDVPHQDVEKVADLEFTFEGEKTLMHVHVFLAQAFTGTPTESEEMRPRWFSVDELPFSDMWPDDHMWLPVVLRGGKVRAAFHFRGHNDILSQRVEEVDAFT
ncbi:hypothetical protein O3P69_003102 [Scylla paramamosain]|uniref:7,8-dihydro-8-oxoguanine triphosphatase n=1 Tax=Scylla paramamosain TaxID=85552 RepID=A0AAW0UJ50_SCYPA